MKRFLPPRPAARLLPCLLLTLLAGLLVGPVRAQSTAFTNLTSVEVKQIGNGVRILFNFDGTFLFDARESPDWLTFVSENQWPPSDFPRVREIKFRIPNARTQAGSFFTINRYPISHVELSIPPGAPEGVGLNVSVVLNTPAMFRSKDINGDDWCCWDTVDPSFDIRDSSDHRTLILTLLSDRGAEQPEVRRTAEDAAKLPSELSLTQDGGVLSVHALNAPLTAFAQAMSEATGVQFVVDDATTRYISLNLPATSFPELLDTLTRTYGLAAGPDAAGGGYWLTDAAPATGSRLNNLVTARFPLRYIRASTASDQFPEFLRSFLRPNEGDNTMGITAPSTLVNKIARDLATLDRPAPQIEVKVTALELSLDEGGDAALNLLGQGKRLKIQTDSLAGDLWSSLVSSPTVEWEAALHSLATRGKVRIAAESRLRLQNGVTSSLFVGQESYLAVRVGNEEAQEDKVINVQTGARLDMTAWTGGGGVVTMTLKPSLGTIVERNRITGLPIVDRRDATTTLRTRSGETIAIGGLVQSSSTVTRRRIPILGSLPLLGGLFRSHSRVRTQRELVFLVTPTDAPSAGVLPAAAQVSPALKPLLTKPRGSS